MYNNPNDESLTQHEKILVIMFRDFMSGKDYRFAKWWRASDFQREHFGIFVGYEATARMSELFKKYPFMWESRTNERFRELKFKFNQANEIYRQLPHEMARHLVREKIIL